MKGKFAPLFLQDHYLSQLWHNQLIGFAILDENCHFTTINETYTRILCCAEADLLNRPWYDFSIDSDITADSYLIEGIKTGKLDTFEHRKRLRITTHHSIEVIIGVRGIHDTHGKFICFYMTCIPTNLLMGGTSFSIQYCPEPVLIPSTETFDKRLNNIYRSIGIILGSTAILGGAFTALYYIVKVIDLIIPKVKGL